ncbi:hypothetical protein [Martelella sp. AD-3]|uniref:hypothetical protein n=1 Tax=Martelella sp. AD-3 TaxID=686597 RepID=UPI000462EA1D|nr:hypothetical protein [Martelella sp. AD-3]AMM83047.1 hypothetical protein AZF01_00615 [Martelella sp. AD-3]MAM08958.1 hypothetical protein [Rhizobiaceae bacterium]
MKLAGLVLVVIGLATLTFRFGLYHYGDVAGDIEGSLLTPLAQLALLVGALLLALHLVLRFVRHVISHD